MPSASLPAVGHPLQFTVHGRGSAKWYAVKSPDGRFVRMGRKEYLIASGLDGRRDAQAVIAVVSELEPTVQVRVADVLQVVSWLGKAGLLALPSPMTQAATASTPTAPSAMNQPLASRPLRLNPLYTKVPLISGRRLERASRWLMPVLSLPALMTIVVLWGLGAMAAIGNWEIFARATGQLFVADGWLWWGVAWLVLKSVHELGHAVMAVRVGSPIRSAGISLIFLAPVPYVDLSDLWAIPGRWQRILCCSGGMLAELSVAACAALVAVTTQVQGLQYFCCALATMGTVSTLAFNASPLMRFDGYYIVSDLLNYPNLYTEAQTSAKRFVGKVLRPWQAVGQPLRWSLVAYGLACYQYRWVMLLSLAAGTIIALQGIGVALVAWGAYATWVAPRLGASSAGRGVGKQHAGSSDGRGGRDAAGGVCDQRRWAGQWLGSALIAAGLGLLGCWLPAPIQPQIPGYVALREPQMIRAEAEGFLVEVLVQGERAVAAGELVARLHNPELETELALKRNELEATQERKLLKRAQGHLAEAQAAQAQVEALQMQVAQLERRVRNLEVRSPRSGCLVQNDMQQQVGLFLQAGQPLAMVARPGELEVVLSIGQQEIAAVRGAQAAGLTAFVAGGGEFTGRLLHVEPRASDQLREPLLAANFDGPLAVQAQATATGEEGWKLLQPRFEAHLELPAEMAQRVAPGQMVWLSPRGGRASLADALWQWGHRKWRSLLQQVQPLS